MAVPLTASSKILVADENGNSYGTALPTIQELVDLIGGLSVNLSAVWPVGSIYTSTDSTNPATTLGFGTWSAFASGRTLVGVDGAQTEFDTVEKTGGEKTHTLTVAEMPSHTHVQTKNSATTGALSGYGVDTSTNNQITSGYSTEATGGDGAHNNLQPYITVYFWKRTA